MIQGGSAEPRIPTVEETRERLQFALEDHGFAMTAQRRVIYQELAQATDHPTADDLYLRLRHQLPELSLATVYKNLHLFSRIGLARAVATPDGKARFDARTTRHHHLRCTQCGAIVDVFDQRLEVPVPPEVSAATGFRIVDSEVQLSGVCPRCQHPGGARREPPGLRRRSGPRRRRS